MIKPEQIPDEVINELWNKGFDFVNGVQMPSSAKIKVMRQCIALAINAWPGGIIAEDLEVAGIILPLPQEKNNAFC